MTTALVPKKIATRSLWKQGGFDFCAIGMRAPSGKPTLTDFAVAARQIFLNSNSSMWQMGDLMVYEEARDDWEDAAQNFIDLKLRSAARIQVAMRVCTTFPFADRPYATLLSFSHHEAVLTVNPHAAKLKWLKRAHEKGWSVLELRENIRPTLDLGDDKGGAAEDKAEVVCPNCDTTFKVKGHEKA